MSNQMRIEMLETVIIRSTIIILCILFIALSISSCSKELKPMNNRDITSEYVTETTVKNTEIIDIYAELNTKQSQVTKKQKTETKARTFDIYKEAVNKIAKKGVAGYKEKQWGNLSKVECGYNEANDIFRFFANRFLTDENEAPEVVRKKGSNESMSSFPECFITDESLIKYSECKTVGENYEIKIVLISDDTPKKNDNHLSQITSSIIYWEDIESLLNDISLIKSIDENQTSVVYNDFTIICTINKDGEIISMSHHVTIDVKAVAVVKLIKTFDVKFDAQFHKYSEYYDFKY